MFNVDDNNAHCYITSAEAKRVADSWPRDCKCSVSVGQQVKNCCPATNIKNKMAAKLASLETEFSKEYTLDSKISC